MLQITNIKNYIKNNKFIFFGVITLYFLGFLIGSVYSNFIDDTAFLSSYDTTKDFLKSLMISEQALNLKELIVSEITPACMIAICGIMLLGLPVVLYLIFKSGFSLGFYITFLIKAFSLKGLYLGMFYLFLNLIVVLPAITLISANSIEFNLYILACVNKKYAVQRNFAVSVVIYVFILILCLLLLALSANLKFGLLPAVVKFLFSSVL